MTKNERPIQYSVLYLRHSSLCHQLTELILMLRKKPKPSDSLKNEGSAKYRKEAHYSREGKVFRLSGIKISHRTGIEKKN